MPLREWWWHFVPTLFFLGFSLLTIIPPPHHPHTPLLPQFVNNGFFTEENAILNPARIERIRHIPSVIIQGRYDMVCPIKSAWDLHKVWPEAAFTVVPDSGHSAFDVGIQRELLNATDAFRV